MHAYWDQLYYNCLWCCWCFSCLCHVVQFFHEFNSYSPEQNDRHFEDDILRCISVKGNFCVLIKFVLKFVSKSPIDNYPALVQIMSDQIHWRIYAALGGDELICGLVCQKLASRAGTNNYISQILWDVIICPCSWYLLLTCEFSRKKGTR